jgi:periplasmic protein TonB
MTLALPFLPGHAAPGRRERIGSAAAVAALHALLGYAFLTGLGYAPLPSLPDELKLFTPADTPPPPPPKAQPARPQPEKVRRKPKPKDPEGAASPANLRNTPTEIVVPPPEIRLPVPPPLPAAPVAGTGSAPAAGAAPVPGPGTGAGGVGNGLGSGLSGNGNGGGGGGLAAPPRLISGRIDNDDYPPRAFETRAMGTVYIRFVVQPNGRATDCAVTRSSGSAELDSTTCRLIERRMRYRPARDSAGRPIASIVRGQQQWEIGPEPPPIDVDPEE